MIRMAVNAFTQLRKGIRKSTALVLIMTMLISIVMPAGVSFSGMKDRSSGGWDVTWSVSTDAEEGRIEIGNDNGQITTVDGDENVYLNMQLIPQGDGIKRFQDTFSLTIPSEIYEAIVSEKGNDLNEWFYHDEYPLFVTTKDSVQKASGSNLASANNADNASGSNASGSDADGQTVTLLLTFSDERREETEAGMSSIDYQISFAAPQAMDLLLVQAGNDCTLTMEESALSGRFGLMSTGDIYEFGPAREYSCALDIFRVAKESAATIVTAQVTLDVGISGYDYGEDFILELADLLDPQFSAGNITKVIISNASGVANEWTSGGQTVNDREPGYISADSDSIRLRLNDGSDILESDTWTLEVYYKPETETSDFVGVTAGLADGSGSMHLFHSVIEVIDESVKIIFHDTKSTAQSQGIFYEDSMLFGIDYNGVAVGRGTIDYWTGAGSLFRFLGWNTARDGFGTWYRGGYKLTAEDISMIKSDLGGELVLYQQYINLFELISIDFSKVKPQIYLEGENNHKTVETAFEVDHAQALHYMSTLDYSEINKQMTTLWGRIDAFQVSEGTLTAYFDARLELEDTVDILFESPWLVPDGIPYVQGTGKNQYIFTAHPNDLSEPLVERDLISGKWVANIPIKLKDKSEIGMMPLEEFLKPMTLTLASNYDLGINAIITRESFNAIATSDNPIVESSGKIYLKVNNISMKADADPQYAKMLPTGSVTVQYIDTEGNTIKALHTMSDRVGDPYVVDIPDIAGYRFLHEIDNKALSGTYELETNQYVLIYEKDPGQGIVTVDYVDTAGATLFPRLELEQDTGTRYTILPPVIEGYTYRGEQTNKTLSGTFSEQTQAYVLVYEKDADPEGVITVAYVDTRGNELRPGIQTQGPVGASYTVEPPVIEGYTYRGEQTNKALTGIFSTQPQAYVLIYEKIPDPTGSIIIRYVDTRGNELLTSTSMSGRVGESYTVTAPAISGYNYTGEENNRNLTGNFTNETVTYVLIYTRRSTGGGGSGGGSDPNPPSTRPTETTPAGTTGPNPPDPNNPTNPPVPTVPGETTPGGGGIIVDIPPGDVVITDKDGDVIFEGHVPDGRIPIDPGAGQYQIVVIAEDGTRTVYTLDMGPRSGLAKTGDSHMSTIMLVSLQLIAISTIVGLTVTRRRNKQ